MKKWTKWIVMMGMCLVMAGCGTSMPDSQPEQSKEKGTEIQAEKKGKTIDESEENVAEAEQRNVWSKEQKEEEITCLEKYFGDGKDFRTMDPTAAASYASAISDAYDFIGRITEDGYGYVLGFKKGTSDPFEGYGFCWKNGVFTVTETEEKTGEEITVFTFSNIENIYFGDERNILYIHPSDYEETENISIAFQKKFCSGEDGRAYLSDVIERKVRFTAPDSGAYLAVKRLENGYWRYEYVPLTEEEEERILQSDALILPEWYGEHGIEFFVNEERYEETGRECEAITEEALKIAEDRCHFVAMDISEIKDIVKAAFKMWISDAENMDQQKGSLIWNGENWYAEGNVDITLTSEEDLQELEEIFSQAEAGHDSSCPYTGILTLFREDGTELVLHLAADGCSGFIFGSAGMYQIGEDAVKRVWEILAEGN